MNEHYNDLGDERPSIIDIRELIAIIIMFSQELYPCEGESIFSGKHPIQSYSGKEASLRRFLNLGEGKDERKRREQVIENMKPVIPNIFELWERIETTFADASIEAGKRYRARKYSKYDNGEVVGKSFVKETSLKYVVPRGMIYPLVGAFRALVTIKKDGKYSWKKDPILAWDDLKGNLVNTLLSERVENPDILAKNPNLWGNLFMQVYIYGLE